MTQMPLAYRIGFWRDASIGATLLCLLF